MLWNRYLYQCFALAFSYICLSDWISIVNGLFTVVYCVYIVLLDFLKFLLKSAEPTHPQAGTKIFAYHIRCFPLQRNQPIPKRGRKLARTYNAYQSMMNQPIPKRGRKYAIDVLTQAMLTNQPIPKRGRKLSSIDHIVTFWQEPPHPHSGTKIYHELQ